MQCMARNTRREAIGMKQDERHQPLNGTKWINPDVAGTLDEHAAYCLQDAFHTAVNRETKGGAVLGPDQRISTLEAVRAYTSYAALFSHSEAWRGTIAPGKVADFVIPSEDILEAPAGRLKGIAFAAAIVDNRVVHGQLP